MLMICTRALLLTATTREMYNYTVVSAGNTNSCFCSDEDFDMPCDTCLFVYLRNALVHVAESGAHKLRLSLDWAHMIKELIQSVPRCLYEIDWAPFTKSLK